MALSRSALQTAKLHTVLTLEVRGHRYRYSDVAFSITNTETAEGGAVLSVAPGLEEPDIVEEVAASGAGLEPVGCSVTCGDEWAQVVAHIRDASGELAQVSEGSDWADRHVLVAGRVSEPVYGASDETIDFSVGGDVLLDTGVLPQPQWIVDSTTWPRTASAGVLTPDDCQNVWYNVVFGHPGQGLTTGRPISACIVEIDSATNDNSVNPAIILLAYGHITCTSITLYNDSTELSATVTPSWTRDNRGTPVTIVSVAVGTRAIASGDELWWRPLVGGGLRSLTGTGTMRSAGEVVQWILGYATVPIDTTRTLSTIAQLQAYQLDFIISEPIGPVEMATDQILPLMPVALTWGPGGAYLAPIPWRAIAKDALWQIDPDKHGGYRSGKVTTRAWSELVTVLRLEYNVDLKENKYQSSLTVAYDADGSDPLYQPHPLLTETATRWAGVRSGTFSTDVICDDTTAAMCLDYQAAMASSLTEEVGVVLPQEYQAMKAGDVALVTLADIGWSERVCYAVSVPRIGGDIVVAFRTLPNWIRDGGGP